MWIRMRIQAPKMMRIHAVDSDSQPPSQLGDAIIVPKGIFYPTLNTQTWRKVYLNLRHILRDCTGWTGLFSPLVNQLRIFSLWLLSLFSHLGQELRRLDWTPPSSGQPVEDILPLAAQLVLSPGAGTAQVGLDSSLLWSTS
jgi:hypothetical protein